jgi:hypothetical protein
LFVRVGFFWGTATGAKRSAQRVRNHMWVRKSIPSKLKCGASGLAARHGFFQILQAGDCCCFVYYINGENVIVATEGWPSGLRHRS